MIYTEEETGRRWSDLHREFALELLSRSSVREGISGEEGFASRIDERLVQAIWHDQMLRGDDLATASGKRLEIVEPGRWNTARGPDFLDARIRLAGEIFQGDIEIHVNAADWMRHRHNHDFEYNRVCLHVSLHADSDRPFDEKQNGERLERLILHEYLEPDPETIRATINPGDYPYGRPVDLGICHDQFCQLSPERLHEFLLVSGHSRMEAKVARFRSQLESVDFYQLIYQSLMTGQGFKSSKTLYFLLSKRTPLAEMLEYARDFPSEEREHFFLSAFMNVAQILPHQLDLLEELDEESRLYYERSQEIWKQIRPYFSDRLIPPTKRWFSGMRPAGFPPRRFAAVAILLGRLTNAQDPLFENLKADILAFDPGAKPKEQREFWKRMTERVQVDGEGRYFATHFTFGGKKIRHQALLGEPAARSLIFNVFLPLAILDARRSKNKTLEAKAWQVVDIYPALEKNSVVKFMERRLFGDDGLQKGLLKREIFQQAFLKIFSDCCASNERTCDNCTFLAVADAKN